MLFMNNLWTMSLGRSEVPVVPLFNLPGRRLSVLEVPLWVPHVLIDTDPVGTAWGFSNA